MGYNNLPPAWFSQELLRIAGEPMLKPMELFSLGLVENLSDGDIYEWVSKQK